MAQSESKKRRKRRTRAIDEHVGRRVRLRRTLLGISQQELGAALGVTFQQVQKYEKGTNRVSASTLYVLSNIFSVPLGFFFDDMPSSVSIQLAKPPGNRRSLSSLGAEEGLLKGKKLLILARAFSRIRDERLQNSVLQLVKATAEHYELTPR